ncbi:MAG: peptidoglycan -binding protein [Paracoccus sp. (in: a-proteobacteria)]|nr:peptidoglycan -binding protein [Paracoccus sp. (in: a-proteobacteria)]
MALHRARSANRFNSTIWPGFVDAMTALLMVLMFVITIFMVVQSVLREQVDAQESQLDQLGEQIAGLTSTLAVAEGQRDSLGADLAAEQARVRALDDDLGQALSRITGFEAQVAALIAARDAVAAQAGEAEAALSAARDEIDAQAEEARLAAARREALEALLAEIRAEQAETAEALGEAQAGLTEAEAARLADAAAAEALRARLEGAEAELTAMTLSLEQSRREAEETLTLLAAAEAARAGLVADAEQQLTEAERQAGLLVAAQAQLADQEQLSSEAQRRVALLNEQVSALNAQLGTLQSVLAATEADRAADALQLDDLGAQLNAALLRATREQEARLELEEAERTRLEQEAADLARYRSEFFGRLSQILEGREGVNVVGDRFVFSSEVLFGTGEAVLSDAGRAGIAQVASMLRDISDEIPPEIDWIIRVDGHTDNVPLSGQGRFRDNWELSQARALAVVRYLVEDQGFPAERLAATGFAEFRPVATGNSPEARAQNRRIELKLTER